MDFKGIFDRHFFSNHHVEAKRLESRLEQIFVGCECITYSSLPGLLTAVLDELCEGGAEVHVNWDEQRLKSINTFFHATARKIVRTWSKEIQAGVEAMSKGFAPGLGGYIQGALIRGGEVSGLLLDFSACSDLLESAAVFVTPHTILAEKVRWSRSSYGHRAATSINIAANGRFSEFQAHLLNLVLDEAGFGG